MISSCPTTGGIELSCDDDSGLGVTSVIEWDVVAGTSYFLQLEGYFSDLSSADVAIMVDTLSSCSGGSIWDTGDTADSGMIP